MTGPRHVNGRPLVPLGPGWVGLTTHTGQHLTNPTPGYVWLHMDSTPGGGVDIMFNPDNSDDDYRIVQTVITPGAGFITFGSDDYGPLLRHNRTHTVYPGDVVYIDTNWVKEVMA